MKVKDVYNTINANIKLPLNFDKEDGYVFFGYLIITLIYTGLIFSLSTSLFLLIILKILKGNKEHNYLQKRLLYLKAKRNINESNKVGYKKTIKLQKIDRKKIKIDKKNNKRG